MTEVVPFTPPAGGVDAILAALARRDPRLPGFVYERQDPASRQPLTTWIGLRSRRQSSRSRPGSFATLRGVLARASRQGEQGVTCALLGYPGTAGAETGGQEGGDQFLTARDYLKIDHRRHTGAVVRLDEPGAPDWPTAGAWARLLESAPSVDCPPAGTGPGYDWSPSVSAADFTQAVERLREEAGDDRHTGAVLSVRIASTLASDPLGSYRCLRAEHPSTCMFLLQVPGFALWGSTSLPLAEIAGRRLIAQTDGATVRVPDGSAGQWSGWTPTAKQLSEYDVVAAALRDDLTPVTRPGSLRFTREREQRFFSGLGHLFAEAEGDLADGVDEVAAVEALFPHGATVGYPRKQALRLIDLLERAPRGPFAGAIGIFESSGVTDAAAVTRSAWTTPAGTFAQAGAKVVPGSVAQQEYDECMIKTRAVRDTARPAPTGGRP